MLVDGHTADSVSYLAILVRMGIPVAGTHAASRVFGGDGMDGQGSILYSRARGRAALAHCRTSCSVLAGRLVARALGLRSAPWQAVEQVELVQAVQASDLPQTLSC